MKRAGEPSAGKLHAGFDEEGAGNGAKDRIEAPALWRKPPGTATPRILKLPRQLSTLREENLELIVLGVSTFDDFLYDIAVAFAGSTPANQNYIPFLA
jgi:hypothetical protein